MTCARASVAEAGLALRQKRQAAHPAHPWIGAAHPFGAGCKAVREPGEASGDGARRLQRQQGVGAVKASPVQSEDHARFEVVALPAQACDEAGRCPAVDEPQGFSDPRLEPGFRHVEAAERAFAIVKQERFVRGREVRGTGLSVFRCHLDPLRSPHMPSAWSARGRRLSPPDARLARRSRARRGSPPGPRSGSASCERPPSLSSSKKDNRK